jgi:hypothetical protein
MKKHKLQLNRTTVQQLTQAQATDVRGGIRVPPSTGCTLNHYCHSILDSCKDSDCCLEVP